MPDQQPTPPSDAAPDPAAVEPPDESPAVDDADGDTGPNTEAAKYRRRLRDTEAQLTAATERLTAYQRRHAENVIADVLATPADLFDIGQANLADFLDDSGDVLTDELIAAAAALVDQRPQLGAHYQPPLPPGTAYDHGVRGQHAPAPASWAQALGANYPMR